MSELEQELQTGNSFLNDLLASIDEQEVTELGLDNIDETYVIKDMAHANYMAKKLKEVRSQIDIINTTSEQQINSYTEKVERFRTSSLAPLVSSEGYLIAMIEEFAKRQLEGSTKKSIKLLDGTAQFRTPPAKFEYDEEVLLAFLQTDLPAFIRQKPSVDKTELKKAGKVNKADGSLTVEGKIVPGVTITPQEEKFEVK